MRHKKNDNRLIQLRQAITHALKTQRSWAIIGSLLLTPTMANAATSVTVPIGGAAVPITIPGVKAGDTINVQAGLSSVAVH